MESCRTETRKKWAENGLEKTVRVDTEDTEHELLVVSSTRGSEKIINWLVGYFIFKNLLPLA